MAGLNLEIVKTNLSGIRSLNVNDMPDKFEVTMQGGNDKPVFVYRKNDGAISFHPENFKSTGLDWGRFLIAISNAYMQGDLSMKQVKTFGQSNPNTVATIDRDGNIKLKKNAPVTKDDLSLFVTRWLMNDLSSGKDPVDPIVGLVGLGRMVEKNKLNTSRQDSQNNSSRQNLRNASDQLNQRAQNTTGNNSPLE